LFKKSRYRSVYLTAILAFTAVFSAAAQGQSSKDDFASKSIEELMNVDVTSVSRKDQKLSKTPAAIYVITQEAIQRSGATNIPDLLRMAPGVQVAQVEPDRWAISVRGFNGIYSNKLLVLVDGRTVYTPSFSGVYWDQVAIPLDTIERIEITRGSGGTIWGANAVNGVINIITMSSRDTLGNKITAGAGSSQIAGYQVRFGGRLGGSGSYRIFGAYSDFNSLPTRQGQTLNNGSGMEHGGFRVDQKISSSDSLTVEGNVINTNGGLDERGLSSAPVVATQLANHEFDVMGRWTRIHSDRSQSSLQVYQTDYSRHDTGMLEKLNTFDLDFQNQVQLGSRNDIVWGAGYRYTSDNIRNVGGLPGFVIQLDPRARTYNLFSTFIQDEISLTDKLALTVGSKVEHNAFSGFEYQPGMRLAWTVTGSATVWAAASRAVRQPSRMESALHLQYPLAPIGNGLALSEQLLGNPGLEAETVNEYEIGYRMIPNSRVSFDITSFHSAYGRLQSLGLATPSITATPQTLILNLADVYQNERNASNYGAEGTLTWNVLPRWKLAGNYSWLKSDAYFPGTFVDTNLAILKNLLPPPAAPLASQFGSINQSAIGLPLNGTAPGQQFGIQSYFDVFSKASFDNSLYYVGGLDTLAVPAYLRLDARFGYKLRKGIEVSLVGQNLLSPSHAEFGDLGQAAVSSQIQRSVFGSVAWSF